MVETRGQHETKLMTSPPGHHFCDRCNDVAFGEVCRDCGQPARWVPDAPRPLTDEIAHLRFAEIRELVAATTDPFQKS